MPVFSQYPDNRISETATIGAGQNASNVLDLNGCVLTAIAVPSNWTSANISLSVSNDNINWYALYNTGGTEYILNVPGSLPAQLAIDPTVLHGARYVQVISGTHGAKVNQVNAVSLTVVARPNP